MLGIFAAGFGEPILNYFTTTYTARAFHSLPKNSWKVLLQESCGRGCEKLWTSPDSLANEEFYSKVRSLHGKKFWVGFEVAKDEQAKILSATANALVIGRINADYKVYVNGDFRLMGSGRDGLITTLPLAASDFSGTRPLRVSLEIDHNMNSVYPVAINEPSVEAGFYEPSVAISYRDRKIFLTTVRPVALGMAALLSAIAFFCLWLNVRDRNEFFVFSLFCFCLFSSQVLNWTSVSTLISRDSYYLIDLALRVCEGVLIGSLGLAYSRARIESYLGVVIVGIMSFLMMHRAAFLGSDLYFASAYVANSFVPVCFCIGIFTCLSQSSVGELDGFRGMAGGKILQRTARLRQFSALLFILGVVYLFSAVKIFSLAGASASYWHRPVQFLFVGLLGAFLFRDFREFDLLQQKSYFSKFHSPLLKEQQVVTGYLLEVDMKESSALYDLAAQEGHLRDVPSIWNEAASQITATFGGEILTTEGDAFRAFFDSQTALHGIMQALAQIVEFGRNLDSHGHVIEFRATVVKGQIRPVYKEINGKLFEDYDHAPGDTCFKDASRFLREEKRAGIKGTVLVIESSVLAGIELPSGLETIKKEKLSVADVGQRELAFVRIGSQGASLKNVA